MNANGTHNGKIKVAMLLVTLGIIYGDIGTSPLYVLKAIVGDREITKPLVYGGISCVFWTLMFQTTVKYIWLTLRADNEGEGGIFSLYALVRRYSKNLVIPTILGATTLLADGIITPPISIASAVEGLDLVIPHLDTVPIVVAILSALFFFQRFGTQKVGSAFGPVMALWFSMLFVLGLRQIFHFPDVIQAFNPVWAINLLIRYPHGFWLLGAVFLCTTGAEALYSDLGHCGKKYIRITWAFVKICLVTNYAGQAAWLLHGAGSTLGGRNPIFEIMPSWFLIPGIMIATTAAIIASQALISGSFTLISEAMSLNFWPRVTVRQPSELKGQIYIPSVNTILWVSCVLCILYFRNSKHMEAAYGFSITIAMIMTTVLLSHFLYFKLRWKWWVIAAFLMMFGLIEVSFFIANVVKLTQSWMFVFYQIAIFTVMYIWYYARKTMNRFLRFTDLGRYAAKIRQLSEDRSVPKFCTHLIYLTKADNRNEIEEKIMMSILAKKPKRADVYWFLHLNRTEHPYTLNYEVSELIIGKLIKVTINVGFRIQPRTELYFKMIMQDLLKDSKLNPVSFDKGASVYNEDPDFKFIIVQKFLSVENEFNLREGLIMSTYFMIKKLGLKDEKAFGLDRSDVLLEYVPFIYNPIHKIDLKRVSPRF